MRAAEHERVGIRSGAESLASKKLSLSRLIPIRVPEPNGTQVNVNACPGWSATASKSALDHSGSALSSLLNVLLPW
jgi:hypothetical protein